VSMADLQEALRLIATSPGQGFFAGPRDATLVASAERALGGNLPPTYREFVTKLGAGNFGAFEVYGVIEDKFEDSSVPNGVWLTLNERRESGLPEKLVIVGSTGDGDYYCVELRGGEESPVTVYQPGSPPDRQHGEQVAQDFGDFFLGGVRAEL
jgi:hypothetical protein